MELVSSASSFFQLVVQIDRGRFVLQHTDALAPDTNRHLFVRSFTSLHLGTSRVRVRVRFRFHSRSLLSTSSSYFVVTKQRSKTAAILYVSSLRTDENWLKIELLLQSGEFAYSWEPYSIRSNRRFQLILVKMRQTFAENCSRNHLRAGASNFVILPFLILKLFIRTNTFTFVSLYIRIDFSKSDLLLQQICNLKSSFYSY